MASNFKSLYLLKWCSIIDTSPLTQFSKFNNFLWVCWFLGKNLSNFVPPVWKLHNPYCHKLYKQNFLLAKESVLSVQVLLKIEFRIYSKWKHNKKWKVKGDVFWNFCVLLNINYSENVLVYVCFFLIKTNGNETKLYF